MINGWFMNVVRVLSTTIVIYWLIASQPELEISHYFMRNSEFINRTAYIHLYLLIKFQLKLSKFQS